MKYTYLTYYVQLVGIEGEIDCKKARSGKFKKNSEKTVRRFLV
jgi:hypothetical protein